MRRALIALLVLPAAALAADAPRALPKQMTDLQACRGIADSAERLACYDRTVAALSAAAASSQVVIIDKQEIRKARKGLFGFTLPRIGFLTGRDDDPQDVEEAKRLETKIVSVRQLPYGKWRFTVEAGGVWETTEADSRFNDPKPGMTVLLERGLMGAYYATAGGKGRRVQAKRVG